MTLLTKEQSYITSAATIGKRITSENVESFIRNTKKLSDIVELVKEKAENCHTEGMIDASHTAEGLISTVGNEAIRMIRLGDRSTAERLVKPYNDVKKEYYKAKHKFDTECFCITRLATQEMTKEKKERETQKIREEWWTY